MTAGVAWTAAELSANPGWVRELSAPELRELEAAVAVQDGAKFPRETIRLPTLSDSLVEPVLDQLENGLGTVLLRGLPVDRPAHLRRLLLSLGEHLGTPVSQAPSGELLHEVRVSDDPTRRGTRTAAGLNLHTDPCDVTALLCVSQGVQGGESLIVSSVAIHQALRSSPDLLEALYEPYPSTLPLPGCRVGPSLLRRPIFAREQGGFVCNFAPHFIEQALADPGVAPISGKQAEALEAFRELAGSEQLCHLFSLRPGDLLLINNFVTLHARRAFTDGASAAAQRLLLRLWLAVPNSRPLPESYRGLYGATGAGEVRGGYPSSRRDAK